MAALNTISTTTTKTSVRRPTPPRYRAHRGAILELLWLRRRPEHLSSIPKLLFDDVLWWGSLRRLKLPRPSVAERV